MCCRNAFASILTPTSDPTRATSRRVTVRTGVAAWHSAARKLVKSCSPRRYRAPSRMRASSSGRNAHPALHRAVDVGRKTHDLMRRMHARVRATRTDRGRFHAQEFENRPLERFLHRGSIGLNLPAVESTAVVLDSESQRRHSNSSLQALPMRSSRNSARAFCSGVPCFLTSTRSSRAS